MKTMPTAIEWKAAVLFVTVLPACCAAPAMAAILPGGVLDDGQTSVVYWSTTGELAVDAPLGQRFTSINVDSQARVFTGDPAQNLGGAFDNDADVNIFKATFGDSFGSISFGNVAQTGLSQEFMLGDLSVVGSLAQGLDLGRIDLVYIDRAKQFNVSFGDASDVNTLDVDFGDVQLRDIVPPISFELTSLMSFDGINYTAGPDLVEIRSSGDIDTLSTNLAPFTSFEPGQSRPFAASISTDATGRFASDFDLKFINSADPLDQDILRIHLSGTVIDPPVGALLPVEVGDGTLPSIVYDPMTGELSLNTDFPLTAINVVSASGIFTGPAPAGLLDGSFDNHDAHNVFKATFGDSFGAVDFGPIVQPGLSFEFLLKDLTVIGSHEGGGGLDNVFLVAFLPEPSAIALGLMAVLGGAMLQLSFGSRRVKS